MEQEELKSLVEYDKDTGTFYRKTSNGGHKIGSIMGTVNDMGYVIIRLNRRNYKAHRLAVLYETGKEPKQVVDHIDRNRTNNSYSNLRQVTKSQNQINRTIPKNKSGITGVYFVDGRKKPWRAIIKLKTKRIELGYFETLDDAAEARRNAEAKYHGTEGKSPRNR